MGVLTKDVHFRHMGTPTKFRYPVGAGGADEFYAGALLFGLAAGGCSVVPVATARFLGIVAYHQSPTAAGQFVECYIDGIIGFPTVASVAAGDEGDALVMDVSGTLSDNYADAVASSDITVGAGDILIGRVESVETGVLWVYLHRDSGIDVAGIGFGAGL